ncbi:MAG: tetratricopeptide repeat protein [bacterium]|nr:tetratricopeptide repeat protein [bacterium]
MNKGLNLLIISLLFFFGFNGCVKANEEDLFNEAKSLQEKQQTKQAIAKYEELISKFPKGKYAAKSQFMVGFLYANELKDYSKAKSAYENFLKNYSTEVDSGMVASAKWELKYLGKDINEIEELKNLVPPDTTNTK